MASNIANLGGYDCKFIEEPPDDLICLICTFVSRDPQQVTCCGKIFCRACLVEQRKRSNACPQCRKTGNSFPDQRSDRHIKGLQVKCDNLDNGCNWVGQLNSLQKHSSNCDYSLINCRKCNQAMLHKDLESHQNKDCPNRIIICKHCKLDGKAAEITTTHLETCPQVEIKCPNAECAVIVPRCKVLDHRSECLYEKKGCIYRAFGCKTELIRKDITGHETNYQLHLDMALKKVLDLTAKVSTYESKLRSLETEVATGPQKFVFKIEKFSELKHQSKKIATPSFYDHPGGYKLSSTINANGGGKYKGKSIAIYMLFHRGENDDNLVWPFTGSITIEVLNQLADDNHHKQTLSYQGENDETNNQVKTERGVAETGRGFHNFLSHTELDHKQEFNCQYLKDDCLFFRFTVLPPQQPRPWLVCIR